MAGAHGPSARRARVRTVGSPITKITIALSRRWVAGSVVLSHGTTGRKKNKHGNPHNEQVSTRGVAYRARSVGSAIAFVRAGVPIVPDRAHTLPVVVACTMLVTGGRRATWAL